MKFINPWVDSFKEANSIDYIRAKTLRTAKPLHGLDEDLVEVACAKIKQAFGETFVPTMQACQIMKTCIELAQGYAQKSYPSNAIFMEGVYVDKEKPEPCFPIILTGPAGVGKSEIRKALIRLFGRQQSIKADVNHGPFPLKLVQAVVAHGKKSVGALLMPLARPEVQRGELKIKAANLLNEAATWIYISGCSLLLLDELQFLTLSEKANTNITDAMMTFSCIGPPSIVICNYSLVHRLRSRGQEDRQRLLSRSIVLLPDAPNSPDWKLVLGELQKIVPNIYEFNFKEKAVDFWNLTAGLKRLLIGLLLIAYRVARRDGRSSVIWADIDKAYLSSDYSADRIDVDLMILNGIFGSGLPKDLTCPFPLPISEGRMINASLENARKTLLAESVALSSMSVNEKKTLAKLQSHSDEIEASKSRDKKSSSSRKKIKAEDLIRGANIFKDKSKK